jgi:hypothetical protein
MLPLLIYNFHAHAAEDSCRIAAWFDTFFLWG